MYGGQLDPYKTINHKDLDKTNNHISNLELITNAENVQHARDSERKNLILKHEVLEFKKQGLTTKEIMTKTGLSESSVKRRLYSKIKERQKEKYQTDTTNKSGVPVTNDELIEIFINDPKFSIGLSGSICLKESQVEIGHTNKSGDILIGYRGKALLARRIIYRKFIGELVPDLVVIHKDGNKQNLVPENLEQVTDREATIRMMKSKNITHAPQKLTWGQVREMRTSYLNGEVRFVSDLVRKYGVSHPTIRQILKNEIWKDPNYQPPHPTQDSLPKAA